MEWERDLELIVHLTYNQLSPYINYFHLELLAESQRQIRRKRKAEK